MKNAVILHGLYDRKEYFDSKYPSPSNAHWIPWLQRQLQLKGIKADTPEVHNVYEGKWDNWQREVERFEIGAETTLVGHSCGGGFWLKYLSKKQELKVGKVVLVAPWLDPDGDETDMFNDLKINKNLLERTAGITIFFSDNDMGNVHKSVAIIKEALPDANYREFKKYGHFCIEDMKTDEFPELLEECLKV